MCCTLHMHVCAHARNEEGETRRIPRQGNPNTTLTFDHKRLQAFFLNRVSCCSCCLLPHHPGFPPQSSELHFRQVGQGSNKRPACLEAGVGATSLACCTSSLLLRILLSVLLFM